MGHVIRCSSCDMRFRVAAAHLGKMGACPGCQARIKISADGTACEVVGVSAGSQPAAKPKVTLERLQAALSGPIPPVRATLTYRVALLAATVAILLTPAVYLAVIAATGYGVYYHAVNHQDMLTLVRGRGAVLVFLAYAAPLVVGPILVFFMLKPFFTRPSFHAKSRSLVRDREPVLFGFVDMICEAVRAPRPSRIDLDCQMNASASFRRGFGSMVGNDMVLTIGLPLMAGLSLRQFGGVLAHEFGHFSQGAGMRLTYVLRSVSAWLQRSVYQRDQWDEWLTQSAHEADLRIGWVLWLAILFVWIARRILWLLMMLSMIVVGYALRQMEYDADRYKARFAGSGCFEETVVKLARLGVSMQKAYAQLGVAHRDGKLVDDLPRLVMSNERRLEPSVTTQISDQIRDSKTSLFDSHPTDRDRIANAHREDAAGVFRLEGQAGELLSDFVAQCRATTLEFYREALGSPVSPDRLVPVESLAAEHEAQDAAIGTLERYTQGAWRPTLRTGLRRDCLMASKDPKAEVSSAAKLRKSFLGAVTEHRERIAKLDEWRGKLTTARAFEMLHRAGVRLGKKDLPPGLDDKTAAFDARKQAERRVAVLSRQIEESGELVGDRLAAVVRLLCHPAVYRKLPEGRALKKRAEQLVPALVALEGQLGTINSLREQASVLTILFASLEHHGPTEELINRIIQLGREVHPKLQQLKEVLAHAEYPFDCREKHATLASRLIPTVPGRDETGDLLDAIRVAADSISDAQGRILAGLCVIAETVEKAVKLPKLPEVAEAQ